MNLRDAVNRGVNFFVTEHDDSNAVGPDIGLIVTLGLATFVFTFQYFRTRRLLSRGEST